MDRDTAHAIVTAAQGHALARDLAVTVAVVDAGGHLVVLDRMDGAFPLSTRVAEAKAQGAAIWQRDGHVIAEQQSERPAFVAAMSELSRLPLIPGAGSVVVRDADGAVLGAVGVSGATPDEDRACAEAGLTAVGR
ncbi:MAG TPA: heme-binding protein [Solirubrobacteraceae bacterium]|nr:heme-binding protein [Solirubrobacteraceae bacterium]